MPHIEAINQPCVTRVVDGDVDIRTGIEPLMMRGGESEDGVSRVLRDSMDGDTRRTQRLGRNKQVFVPGALIAVPVALPICKQVVVSSVGPGIESLPAMKCSKSSA